MPPHITTGGTGRREAMPDLATVELSATGDGESAAVAYGAARDCAATVTESLSVSSDRVRTVERRIDDSTELFEPETTAQFRATERLVVECVPETAADVVVEAVDAGATVDSVDFRVHESVRREARDDALAAAMERARQKADRIAAVEDLVVTDVREVRTVDSGTDGMQNVVDDALAFGSDTDFGPTPVEVTGAVEVEFELESG